MTDYYTYPSQAERPVKKQVAVFDFDGTSIRGNSPVLLVLDLIFRRMIAPSVAVRIGLWGLAYKMRLPQNESWVRGEVFKAFEGKPVDEVDRQLRDFYDRVIAERFRPQVDELIERYHEQGIYVMVVSASFEPIILRALEFHAFDAQLSTRMKATVHGTYTREVEGIPVEGTAKVNAIMKHCDNLFGQGNWEVAYAFGDHHSDEPMLSMAQKMAYAVDPDSSLARTAERSGWTVLEW